MNNSWNNNKKRRWKWVQHNYYINANDKKYLWRLLTANPKENTCDRESPNIIPTEVDIEPRHAMHTSLTKSMTVVESIWGDEYKNNVVASTALVMHTRAMIIIGLRGRLLSLRRGVPLSRSWWVFSINSDAAFISLLSLLFSFCLLVGVPTLFCLGLTLPAHLAEIPFSH